MQMKSTYNTKSEGVFYFLITKEAEDYVAVCLNLNIVEYGKDRNKLMRSIEEAAFSYLEAVRKGDLSDENLNKLAPEKYWKIFNKQVQQAKLLKRGSASKSKKKPSRDRYFEYKTKPYEFNFA